MAAPLPLEPTPAAEAGAGTHLFLLLCTALVAAFGAWSYYGKLDVVSTATGEVIPSSQVKSVQHLEGGIVREILVREGGEVEKDQPLVVLEGTESGANVQELEIRITSLRGDVARLETELTGADRIKFPPDLAAAHPDLVQQIRDLFKTRRNRLDNQLAAQRQLITQRGQEIKTYTARLKNERRSLKLLDEQIAISVELLKDGLTSQMLHLNLLKEASEHKARIDDASTALPGAEAARQEARIKLKAIRNDFQEDVREKLEDKRRNLDELSKRISKFEDSLKRTVLRSPVSGVVKTLHVVTVGGVVRPGGTVVDVVPAGDRLIIEAKLPTQDIGYVHPGQTAMVQLASADAIRFGTLEGEVAQVSPDTIETADGVPYYKVRISTISDYFERRGARYQLVPGVQVICSIQTGQRTVLEYLLDPFMGSAQTALRER